MTGVVAAKRATRSGFFVYMALGFLAIALIGLSTTFFLPLIRGTFAESPVNLRAWNNTLRLVDLAYRASITHPRAERLCAPPAWLAWCCTRRCRRFFWPRSLVPQTPGSIPSTTRAKTPLMVRIVSEQTVDTARLNRRSL